MKRQFIVILFSVAIFANFKFVDDCNCSLKWVWLDQVSEVGLLDKPNGNVLKRIKNNYKEERVIMFEIISADDKWLQVKTIEPSETFTGWILSSKTAAHTKNYDRSTITVYQQPNDKDSKLAGIIKQETKVNIVKCCGEWTKIKFHFNGQDVEGYIRTNQLCGNYYSTCG